MRDPRIPPFEPVFQSAEKMKAHEICSISGLSGGPDSSEDSPLGAAYITLRPEPGIRVRLEGR
jgi:nicotinamide mononucleotide (NMN) deamidase PncC